MSAVRGGEASDLLIAPGCGAARAPSTTLPKVFRTGLAVTAAVRHLGDRQPGRAYRVGYMIIDELALTRALTVWREPGIPLALRT
jgi:hypothetical protein